MNFNDQYDHVAELVLEDLSKVIPYLEKMTGLRYYPVPTLLVDRDSRFGEREYLKLDMDWEILVQNMENLFDFCRGVELTFHVQGFYEKGNGRIDFREHLGESDYIHFTSLDTEKRQKLRWISECMPCRFLELARKLPEKSVLGDMEREFRLYCNNAEEITKILKNMVKQGEIDIERDTYNDYNRYSRGSYNHWQPCFTSSETKKLEELLDRSWGNPLLADVVQLYESTQRILKNLFSLLLSSFTFVTSIDLLGCYIHPLQRETLFQRYGSKGYPENIWIQGSGIVVIAVDEIRDEAKRYVEQNYVKNQFISDQYNVLLEETVRKLTLGTLIHEHTHAIVDAGLNEQYEVRTNKFSSKGKKYKRVSEALAEWSELNFFREDSEMFELVFNHIKALPKTTWPYHWAVNIESAGLTSREKFRAVVRHFRIDTDKAYSLISRLD